jgi:hypothetical protein
MFLEKCRYSLFGFNFTYGLESGIFSIQFGLYAFRQKFSKVIEIWFFLAMYFKNHGYNDDDLGAPSNVIR